MLNRYVFYSELKRYSKRDRDGSSVKIEKTGSGVIFVN